MFVTRPVNLVPTGYLDATPSQGSASSCFDLHLDLLADRQGLGRVVDPLPGNVGDVQQAVDTAQVDEGAVVGDVLDHAVEHLAFLEIGDQLRALLGPGLLEHGTARDHDVAARAVHLEDLEGLRRAHQGADVAHRPDVDLAAGQEGHGAREIDGEAALDAAEDHAAHPFVLFEGLLEQHPGLFALGLVARQDGLAVLVLHALEIDLDLVAGLQFRRLSGLREFLEGDPALRFEPDVDQRRVAFDRNDGALENRAFQALSLTEGFIEQGGKGFFPRSGALGGGGSHEICLPSLSCLRFSGPTGCVRRSSRVAPGLRTSSLRLQAVSVSGRGGAKR
jgi:hypothetical protein